MAQKVSADRIYETSVTTGTGEYTLAGAASGFQPVSVIGANNYDGFFITDDTNWEVIIGTYITGPGRLQRTAVLASSSAGAAVNWGAGTKKIRSGLSAWAANPRYKSKSVAGAANVTLTAEEQRCDILVLTGAITANINVIVDETPWAWSIFNNTTGAFTVTVKTSGGTGVTIDQGRRGAVLCDGTNVVVADDSSALNTNTAVSVAGTVDAITAVFAPVMTAHNQDIVLNVECGGANTSTTPTFNPDGLGAKTIVKGSNAALAAADIPGANFLAQLRYDLSLDKYQLLNPAVVAAAATSKTKIKAIPATVTVTIASPAVMTWTAHGFTNGQPIVLSTTGALPTGLVAGTTYYVLNQATNTFNLAATSGGAAINTSGTQSGVHTGKPQWIATKTTAYIYGAAGGGGGGGGNGAGTYYVSGGGGGGGEKTDRFAVTTVIGTAYTVTLGAGGAGGANATVGTSGGATSLGALLTLSGGGGGQPGTGTPNYSGFGGIGGAGNSDGGSGAGGSAQALLGGGTGGGTGGGAGGAGATVARAGKDNTGAGGGGGGGGSYDAAAGGSGYLDIEE